MKSLCKRDGNTNLIGSFEKEREREIELEKNREINEIQKYKGMKSDAERKE